MRIEGIAIGPKPAEGVDLKEMTGLDKLLADFQLDYRVDPERKTMTLNRLELDLNGLARLELSMVLDGVNPEAVDNAANDATLRTATLVFEDRSLLGKALPAAAKMQGRRRRRPDPDGQGRDSTGCAPARVRPRWRCSMRSPRMSRITSSRRAR